MTTKKDFIAAAKTISAISEKSEKQQVADNISFLSSKKIKNKL